MALLAIIAGVVAVSAILLLAGGVVGARISRRRRARETFESLSSLRSESGHPFFPETAEERRREQRLLAGWDPTYEDEKGADPARW
jgi:Flp pilus assembly protein TadB